MRSYASRFEGRHGRWNGGGEAKGEVLCRRLELWNATDPGIKKEGKRVKVASLELCHEYDFMLRRQGKKVSI